MDQIASILGMPLPVTRAKDCVMIQHSTSARQIHGVRRSQFHSLSTEGLKTLTKRLSFSDDDTVSTESSSEDSFLFECTNNNSVTFANPLITKVIERPLITEEEKALLFYCAEDFKGFRQDFLKERRRRAFVVRFSKTVVSQVWEYQCPSNKAELYYDENDLRRFLEEFVGSLNEGVRA